MITTNLKEDVLFPTQILPVYAHPSKKETPGTRGIIYVGKCILDSTSNKVISYVADSYNFVSNADMLKRVNQEYPVIWKWAYYRPQRTLFHIYGKIPGGFIEIINGYGRTAGHKINIGINYKNARLYTNLTLFNGKGNAETKLKLLHSFCSNMRNMKTGHRETQQLHNLPSRVCHLIETENLEYFVLDFADVTEKWAKTSFESARNKFASYFTKIFLDYIGRKLYDSV